MKTQGKRSVSGAAPVVSRVRKRRLALFRLTAMLLPLFAVFLLEVVLRVFGAGHPTSFFLREEVNGRAMLRDNPKFGWRFFPPAIARTPEPVLFTEVKEPGTYRVFVFGESAAMGDPDPAVGLPRMLQVILEMALHDKKLEVINVAMTAINSHVIREIAKDCEKLDADAWVIYAGNNEVVGPFGAGTVFGAKAPPLGLIRFTLWLKSTRIAQLLERARSSGPVEWEGMEMFLKQQVPARDPRLQRVYDNFEKNMSDVLDRGARSGARVFLSTVAVNLRDFPPFASEHARSLSESEALQWNEHYTNGINLLLSTNAPEGLASFERAANAVPGENTHAEWHYHVGTCYSELKDEKRSAQAYRSACEFDTLRFRADTRINEMLRSLPHGAGVRFIDAADRLPGAFSSATIGKSTLPGDEAFYEHVHLTFDGNYALARLFAEEMLPESTRTKIPAAALCAQRLGWNEWKQRNVFVEVRKRLQQPPFTGQFGHAQRDGEWEKRIDHLSRALTLEKLREIASTYAAIVNKFPNDWVVREDYAAILGELADHSAAIEQWRKLAALLPHDALPYFQMGNAMDALGRPQEAIPLFQQALRLNPSLVEARNGLALALGATGQGADARRELERAIHERPRFAQARVNLGQILAASGDAAAARAHYEAALKIEPNSAAARVNLGKLLSVAGDKAGAVEQYTLALKLSPHNAVAHYNLANALAVTNALLAVQHYKAAVLAKPAFAEARYALALELARQNKMADALEQFAETVRLRPEMAEAHFNYGVALAKVSRFPEAAREFRETLRLNPNDAKAKEFLQRATNLGGG